jgi:hypothetical protein
MASLPLLSAKAQQSDAVLRHAFESALLNSPIALAAFLPRRRTMSSVPSTRCMRSSGKNRSKPPESGPRNRWYAAGTLRCGQTGYLISSCIDVP